MHSIIVHSCPTLPKWQTRQSSTTVRCRMADPCKLASLSYGDPTNGHVTTQTQARWRCVEHLVTTLGEEGTCRWYEASRKLLFENFYRRQTNTEQTSKKALTVPLLPTAQRVLCPTATWSSLSSFSGAATSAQSNPASTSTRIDKFGDGYQLRPSNRQVEQHARSRKDRPTPRFSPSIHKKLLFKTWA